MKRGGGQSSSRVVGTVASLCRRIVVIGRPVTGFECSRGRTRGLRHSMALEDYSWKRTQGNGGVGGRRQGRRELSGAAKRPEEECHWWVVIDLIEY